MNTTPPPGWYPNQHGQTQWWDGFAWGPLAETATPPAAAQAPAAQAPAYAPPRPVRAVPAAERSKLVWWSFGAVGAGLVLAVLNLVVGIRRAQALSLTFDAQPGPVDALLTVSGILIPVLMLAALALAIFGRIRSRHKRTGTVAIVVAAIGIVSPVILTAAGFLFWMIAGGLSQYSGGTTFG